jgi:MurNAc alpha-1-phosphate uridylyltransferase
LETAGGIVHALPMLTGAGDDWFAVINGDIWCDFDLRELKPPDNADALLVLTDNPAHNPQGDFALEPDGRIGCDQTTPRLTFTGVSLLNRRLFARLTDQSGKLGPLLQQSAAANRVKGVYHGGQWLDVGTPVRLSWLDQQLRAPDSWGARDSRGFQW